MQKFLVRIIIFSIPLIIISKIGELAEPEYGDLFRMAKLTTNEYYPKDSILTGVNPEFPRIQPNSPNVLVIGDSFVNRANKRRNFHTHLPDSINTFIFSSLMSSESNPFCLLKAVRDSLTRLNISVLDAVIIESVERNFCERLKNTEQTDNPSWFQNRNANTSKHIAFAKIGDGITFIKSWVYAQLKQTKTGSEDVKRINLDNDTWVPVYAKDLAFREIIDTTRILEKVDNLILTASHLFPEAQIHILVCPDKSTIYQAHITDGYEVEIPDWGELHPSIIYPIHELKEATKENINDVYRYGDTHFGIAGARIVGHIVMESTSLNNNELKSSASVETD